MNECLNPLRSHIGTCLQGLSMLPVTSYIMPLGALVGLKQVEYLHLEDNPNLTKAKIAVL